MVFSTSEFRYVAEEKFEEMLAPKTLELFLANINLREPEYWKHRTLDDFNIIKKAFHFAMAEAVEILVKRMIAYLFNIPVTIMNVIDFSLESDTITGMRMPDRKLKATAEVLYQIIIKRDNREYEFIISTSIDNEVYDDTKALIDFIDGVKTDIEHQFKVLMHNPITDGNTNGIEKKESPVHLETLWSLDNKYCIVETYLEDKQHMSWFHGHGVLVFEHNDDNYPTTHIVMWEHPWEYIESLVGVDWILESPEQNNFKDVVEQWVKAELLNIEEDLSDEAQALLKELMEKGDN